MESAQNKIESAAQKAKNEQVKLLLGKYLTAGNQLIAELANKDDATAKTDAETWVTQSHNLIAAAYGDGEAALFLDDSGYIFYANGSAKSRIRNWIDGRLRRMTELLRRTDTLTVKQDFSSAQFR
jgi:sensor domain CHASE-containing protein